VKTEACSTVASQGCSYAALRCRRRGRLVNPRAVLDYRYISPI
jgi:hypothetical protein